METPNFTPGRIDRDPVVLGKCTRSEVSYLMLSSVITLLPVAMLVGSLTGAWPAAIGVMLLGSLGVFTLGVNLLGVMKRGKPNGYFSARFQIAIRDFSPLSFVHYSGHWQGRRS